MDDKAPDLGELEREVMQLVWAAGETTAEAIRERLARKPKESTVRTVLRRLEEKGYVTHTVDGRTYALAAQLGAARHLPGPIALEVTLACGEQLEPLLPGDTSYFLDVQR